MVKQILRDQTLSNLFPIRAARFYLEHNSYTLDPKKENELYEEHWPRQKVARLLLIEAKECEDLLSKELAKRGVPSLDNLFILDPQAVHFVFEQLFPLLEELLLQGVPDTFYENVIDSEKIKEVREDLNDLNTSLGAPAQITGQPGKREAKAPFLIKLARENADALVEIHHTEIIVKQTVDRIVQLDTGTPINPKIAERVITNIVNDPQISTIANKIANLPEEEQEAATITFQETLQQSVAQSLAEIRHQARRTTPDTDSLTISPLPTTASSIDQTRYLAEQIISHIVGNTQIRDLLVDQSQKILTAPVISSPLTQQPSIQQIIVPAIIQTITDQAATVTGQPVVLAAQSTIDLTSHVSDLLATPNENTVKVIAQITVDSLPPEITQPQRQTIIDWSATNIANLSVGQFLQPAPSTSFTLNPEALQVIKAEAVKQLSIDLDRVNPTLISTPQFTEMVIENRELLTVDQKTQTITQLASNINPTKLSRPTAEEIVRSYLLLSRSPDGEILLDLSVQDLRQVALLAIVSTGATADALLVNRIVDLLIPTTARRESALSNLHQASTTVQVVQFSPQLSSLLKSLPPISRPAEEEGRPPTRPATNVVDQIRQALLARSKQLYSGNQLTAVNQEIDLLLGHKTGQTTALALTDYLTEPATNRPPLNRVYYRLTAPNQTSASLSRPVNPSAKPITHSLKHTPGASTNGSLLQEILNLVSRRGADSKTAQLIQLGITRLQTATLLFNGINEQDLRATRQYYIERGERANAERIGEINRILAEIGNIRENNPKLSRALNRWRRLRELRLKTGTASPIRTPFSRFGTLIRERNLFDPKIWQVRQEKWLRRIFGEGNIIVRGRITRVNRLHYYRFRLNRFYYGQISRFRLGRAYLRFSKKYSLQGLEKLLKAKTGALGQAALKKLAGTAAGKAVGQAAGKLAASAAGKAISSLLIKLGITAAAGTATGGIGFVVAIVLELGKKLVGGLFKGFKKGLIVFGNTTHSFVLGLAESDPYFDPGTGKLLKFVFIAVGVFFIIYLPNIFISSITSGAFMQARNRLLPNQSSIDVPLECTNTRHLSEEVICKLSQASSPCDNNIITSTTWSEVDSCFSQITLQGNKNGIKTSFKASVDADWPLKRLQCVGFVTGIEAGFNFNFPQRNAAKDYLSLPAPAGYTLTTTGRPTVNAGDLVVWSWLVYGHIAVVVSDNGGTITVAEANGYNGEIRLVAYPFIKIGAKSGNPDGVLTR